MLEPLELAGRVVTADALLTQPETARFLVKDKQAHSLSSSQSRPIMDLDREHDNDS